jgi:hypothetical protein
MEVLAVIVEGLDHQANWEKGRQLFPRQIGSCRTRSGS